MVVVVKGQMQLGWCLLNSCLLNKHTKAKSQWWLRKTSGPAGCFFKKKWGAGSGQPKVGRWLLNPKVGCWLINPKEVGHCFVLAEAKIHGQ